MFRDFLSRVMSGLPRFRSSTQVFADGSRLQFQHRYALRYLEDQRYVDVGFEAAIGKPFDRMIHAWSARDWYDARSGERLGSVSVDKRSAIACKIERYCQERGWTYKRIEEEPVSPGRP